MMRRFVSIVASVAIIISMLPTVCFAETQNAEVEVKGRTNISNVDCYNFSFDFRDVTVGDNTEYSDEVSVLSILLSADFGGAGNIRVVDGDGYVLEQLGFEDVHRINLKEAYRNSVDPNDYVAFYIGRKTITIGRTEYVIYAIAVRGTIDPEEWASNFDVGADTYKYSNMFGSEHPDWVNRKLHKGFGVAANRVYKEVNNYINNFTNEDSGKKQSILITGHSRGAAVANILGKEFEDRYNEDKQIKPYTYTYGTPTVTTESKRTTSRYKTIFNMVNDDDLVPYVPMEGWGFRRYGTDIHTSVARRYKNRWETDNMSTLLARYTTCYSESMSADAAEPGLMIEIAQLIEGLTFDCVEYKSATGYKAEDFLSGLLSKNRVQRESLYEHNTIVWVPQNLDDKYTLYYKDLPYGSLRGEGSDNARQKAAFERFAEATCCKRVLASPALRMQSVINLVKEISDPSKQLTLSKLDEMIKFIEDNKSRFIDPDFIEEIFGEYEMSEDLLLNLCMSLVTYNRNIESGPASVKAVVSMVSNDVMGGFLFAHMPTTYYFLASQRIENRSAMTLIPKTSRGENFEIAGNVYEITSTLLNTVSLVQAGNAPIVFIPENVNLEGESYSVTAIGPQSFKDTEAKTVVIGSKKLTRNTVRSAFKDSEVDKVMILVGSLSQNRKYAERYATFFTPDVVGREVSVY